MIIAARLRCLPRCLTALTLLSATGAAGAAAAPLSHEIAHRFTRAPTERECLRVLHVPCYRPAQFVRAYDLSALYARGLNGRGRTIVIVDSFGSPTIRRDLAVFDRAFGLPAPSLRILAPVGGIPAFNARSASRRGWAGETTLDVEYAHAIAPRAHLVLVETPVAETEGTTGFPAIVRAENFVVDHHLGDVIAQSFGAPEPTFKRPRDILALRSAYRNASRHHVSVLAASGDNGAAGYSKHGFFPYPLSGWPSSDPLVTSVGGTQMTLDLSGDRLAPDVVWNQSPRAAAAGGGGVSSVFARPIFQSGVAAVVGARRGTPDVSMNAAGYGAALVYQSFGGSRAAGWYPASGTSESVQLFAGVVAIADQAAGRRLGQLNPALYRLGAARAPGLVDVTRGNNTVTVRLAHGRSITVHGYGAGPGYDLASGLGTVDAAQLVAGLRGH